MAKAAKQQVTVDEAVVAKGGQPSSDFQKQYEDAAGITAAAEASERAAKLFAVPAPELPAEVLPLAVAELKPSPRNPRKDLGNLDDLVRAVEKHGVLSPLLVRQLGDADTEGAYEIISGHRRHAAAVKAGLDSVPCIVLEVTELQALELNLTEQINRSDLTPLEEGEACRRLQELSGYDVSQVAGKLGRSTSWVRGRLALSTATPEVRDALTKGTVTLTLAQALAALPTVKMQVEGLKYAATQASYGRDAEKVLEGLRETYCRPLKGAPWKLTDETLVPEAGACSACPRNTANEKTPGLFDNVKAPPTCADLPCFESKKRAAWVKKTAKYSAAGAKVLSVIDGPKLFNLYGDAPRLNHGSKYVMARDVAQDDGSKRTWSQLVERIKDEKLKPVLHVAQDEAGGIHELYLADKALEAVAEHLELKWARKAVEREAKGGTAAEARDEWAEQQRERDIARAVTEEVVRLVAERIAVKGLTLPQARALASRLDDHELQAFLVARGAQDTTARGIKKLRETAVVDELLSLVFFSSRWASYDGVDEGLVELAKAEGLDLKAMAKAHAAALAEPKKDGA